jgi:hypothetical protein
MIKGNDSMRITEHGILFNMKSDRARAHTHPELDGIMHIFDAYWHGIRSATACLPGHKIALSHKEMPDGDALHHLFSYIENHKIKKICYQGASENAIQVAKILKQEFGKDIRQYGITHVSSAQFDNNFEMKMIRALLEGLKHGLFHRLGAVKPRFHGVIPEFWPHTLINMAPCIEAMPVLKDPAAVLIPVENNWRKNLYSNVLAADHCEEIKKIYVVNWPNGLEYISNMAKVELLPFMRPPQLLACVGSCAATVHASLIECQPMTQLEGLVVGTPCVTARLGVHPEIDQHPLTRITEVDFPDDVGAITLALKNICQLWMRDAAGLSAVIADHVELRKRLSMNSYLDFLN